MNTQVKADIITHARAAPHEEVCGLIYHTDSTVHAFPCANITRDEGGRAAAFEIDPNDYITARGLGEVCGIYHGGMTHANEGFSECDLETANEMGLPIHAYCGPSDSFACYIPLSYQINPVGQPFVWGQWDCYETVRTHYRQKLGVYLADHTRDASFAEAPADAITRYVESDGFSYVNKQGLILNDDILLFKTLGHAHHLGVLVAPNQMLHHPRNQLSRIEPLDGAWLKRLVGVLRYTRRGK